METLQPRQSANRNVSLFVGDLVDLFGGVQNVGYNVIDGLSILQGEYTESGLKLPSRDLASLATQGVCAGAQVRGGLPPNAYTGYGILLPVHL
jgi:hypothetical protein